MDGMVEGETAIFLWEVQALERDRNLILQVAPVLLFKE
jgi:hypothetical protein